MFQGDLDDTLPHPFAGEVRGMAKYSGLNLGELCATGAEDKKLTSEPLRVVCTCHNVSCRPPRHSGKIENYPVNL